MEGGGQGGEELRVEGSSSLRGFQFPSPLDGKRWILRLVLSQGVLCVSGGPLLIRNGRAQASIKGCGWDLALGEVGGGWLEASLPEEILPQLGPVESCQTQPSWQHYALKTWKLFFLVN